MNVNVKVCHNSEILQEKKGALYIVNSVNIVHSVNRVRAIANLESESETKKQSCTWKPF